MNSLLVLGKYLDQPRLIHKFSKAVPYVLTGGAVAYGTYHISNTPENRREKEIIKTASVLGATVVSAIYAPKIASKGEKLIEKFIKINRN